MGFRETLRQLGGHFAAWPGRAAAPAAPLSAQPDLAVEPPAEPLGGAPEGPDDAAALEQLARYGLLNAGNRPYVLTHLARYRATLDLLGLAGSTRPRILELGGGSLLFTLPLRAAVPDAEILIGDYGEVPEERRLTAHDGASGETPSFPVRYFDIERDDWPYPPNSFDLVLCMEIIEHLLVNPCRVFREAHRVLRPGGRVLVTTPNIASYEAVLKLLNFDSPYLYGVYSRHGPAGRHNREYAPPELARLGESCGFATELLTTRDTYPPSGDTRALRAELGERLGPDDWRHQTIFYRGIKTERQPGPCPDWLFDYDPDLHRASLEVTLGADTAPAGSALSGWASLTNHGRYTWEQAGPNRTRLRIQLVDARGRLLKRDYHAIDLAGPIAPGEALAFAFAAPAPADPGRYRLRFDLVHEQVCWFADALGTRPVELALDVPPLA